MSKLKNYAIILASGTGNRFGAKLPKQFVKINKKTILELSIEAFENCNEINNIIVVITPEYINKAKKIIQKNNYKKVSSILCGGEKRKDSSFIGVNSIKEKEANVLIHDCARPFISKKIIKNCLKALEKYKAVGVAIPSTDTVIEVKNNVIENIPERKNLMHIQTPQCFKLSLIKKAHELSINDNNFTDDCGIVLKHNLAEIFIIEGSADNIKITYPDDLLMAKQIMKKADL